MKKIVLVCVAVAALASHAVGTKKPMTPEEKAAFRQRLMQNTGGIIEKEGLGKVVYVNCQKKFPTDLLKERVKAIKKNIRVNFEVTEGAVEMYKLPKGADVAIYIVDDTALPMSLVAVEKHWGLMNVAELDGNESRFNRELVRISILTLGAGTSQFAGTPMNPVSTPADLDKIMSDNITFDSVQSVVKNLKAIGVTETKMSSYLKACKEGWAPAPTNEYQKAIWDKIHEMPTAPIKIKPEAKKVAE